MLNVVPEAVGLSSATEAGISAAMGASTAAGSAALVGVIPMAADVDSAAFAAALNAAGSAYLGAAAEHTGQRAAYSGAQSLASTTYTATDELSALISDIAP